MRQLARACRLLPPVACFLSVVACGSAGAASAAVDAQAPVPRAQAAAPSAQGRAKLARVIKDHIVRCWSAPAGGLPVLVEIRLTREGVLAAEPQVIRYPAGRAGNQAAAAAMRAVQRCITAASPLKLPPDLYVFWKEIEIAFDPRELRHE